jgi:hypothetical protein
MSAPFEIWLRPNRRALRMAMVAPALLVLLGLAVALNAFGTAPAPARIVAACLAILGLIFFGVLAWYSCQPRLAYDGRNLLLYLRTGRPVAVPIEHVECFLWGSGLHELPGRPGRDVQMAQLGVRLAERASDWAEFDVKPALGKWCGGYVTIYGAWCEPLSIERVGQLNTRLAEALEAHRKHLSNTAFRS